MGLLHFLIVELILISYTISGQYSDEQSSSEEENVDSGSIENFFNEPKIGDITSPEKKVDLEDIFDIPAITEIPAINPTINYLQLIDNENGANTGDIVGDCKCLPSEQCGTSFLRIKNKDVCKVYSDMLCCSLSNSANPSSMTTDRIHDGSNLHKCGQSNPLGLGWIFKTDPNEAKNGEFPWMVSILYEKEFFTESYPQKFNVYKCGGSLIHPKVVLTSAECVISNESFLVRAGDWDTQNLDSLFPHQDRKVAKIIVHERFKPNRHASDIALLFLESEFEITENIQTICIKKLNFNEIDMSKCILNGWGRDTSNGNYSTILKKIDLRVMERNQCLSALKHNHIRRSRSQLCTDNLSDRNFCEGDEGSPLVCPIGDTYYQVGVASKHFNCGENKVPSLFMNVSMFNNWIHNRIHQTIGSLRLFQ